MSTTTSTPPLPSLEQLLPSELHLPLSALEIGPFYNIVRAAWYGTTPCELPLDQSRLARIAGVDAGWWACSGHIVLDAAGMVPAEPRGVATFPTLLALFRAAQGGQLRRSLKASDAASARWGRGPDGRPPPGNGLRLVVPESCSEHAPGMPGASAAPPERSVFSNSESARAPALPGLSEKERSAPGAPVAPAPQSAGARAPQAGKSVALWYLERNVPGPRWRHTEYDKNDLSPEGLARKRDVIAVIDIRTRLTEKYFAWADAGCNRVPMQQAQLIAVDRRVTPMFVDWVLQDLDFRGQAGRVVNARKQKNPNGLIFQAFGLEPTKAWRAKWEGNPNAPLPPIWEDKMEAGFVRDWQAREADRAKMRAMQEKLEQLRRGHRNANDDEHAERREAAGA